MGVNIKQAGYCGPGEFMKPCDPQGPTSGKPQPVLDTSNNSGVGPGVNFVQATYSGIPGDPSLAPDVPSGCNCPADSTNVQDPHSYGTGVTPPEIFKGSTSNG